MNEIFSGGFGSRVVQNVRTKLGLAYSVSGSFSASYDHPGIFYVIAATKSASTVAATQAMLAEVGRLKTEPPTPAELSKAKDQVLNSFIFHYDSPDKTLNEQVVLAFYGYPTDTLEKYKAGIEKVTAADVTRVANKYIDVSKLAIIVVGNEAQITPKLDTLGKVTNIDVSYSTSAQRQTRRIVPVRNPATRATDVVDAARSAQDLVDDHRCAFVRHTNAACHRVRTMPASVDPHLKPVDLILTGDHPRRRVGCMMSLIHIVGRIHIQVSGIRIHHHATAIARRRTPAQRCAKIFIMFQHDLLVRTGNEIPRRKRRNSGLLRPLHQVLGKRRRQLTQLQVIFLQHLPRENIHRRRRFAIRRMKIKSAQSDTLLHYRSTGTPCPRGTVRSDQTSSCIAHRGSEPAAENL